MSRTKSGSYSSYNTTPAGPARQQPAGRSGLSPTVRAHRHHASRDNGPNGRTPGCGDQGARSPNEASLHSSRRSTSLPDRFHAPEGDGSDPNRLDWGSGPARDAVPRPRRYRRRTFGSPSRLCIISCDQHLRVKIKAVTYSAGSTSNCGRCGGPTSHSPPETAELRKCCLPLCLLWGVVRSLGRLFKRVLG
jgi:hypothetical protein